MINRYITFPGQACAYKIGVLKILEMRKLAQYSLRRFFDLREYNREILSCPAPMEILETCINNWIMKKARQNILSLISRRGNVNRGFAPYSLGRSDGGKCNILAPKISCGKS